MSVIAYTVELTGSGVLIRCSDSRELVVSDFIQAVDFLTEYTDAIAIVWNLDQFSKALFSLLPEDDRAARLTTESQPNWFGPVKIFWVGKLLGLGYLKPLRGNVVDKLEVNLYALCNWLADNRPEPGTIQELADLGDQVLVAAEKLMGRTPLRLVSPVNLYAPSLKGHVPTLLTNPGINDVCNFVSPMVNLEWTESYQPENYAPTYTADQVSAYPYQMTKLPDTDHCIITHSKEPNPPPCHYAFVKIANLKYDGKIHPLVDLERDIFTGTELRWLKTHSGTFEVVEGYYIHFLTTKHPYREPVLKLFEIKSAGGILGEIGKRCVVGLSGKLDQQNADDKITPLYNPILAAMVRTGCRLANMAFIEAHNLESMLVKVQVDGVTSYQDLNLPTIAGIGQWRQKG